MISGFCKDVFNQLPMEFAVEADRLLSLEAGSRLIVVRWASCRLNEPQQTQARTCAMSAEEEKRMIVENSEVVLSVDLTAEVDGTPILRG